METLTSPFFSKAAVVQTGDSMKLGLLKHFLFALRLKQQNQPGEKARSLNMILKRSVVQGTLANH